MQRRKNTTKKKTLFHHVQQRFCERYGLLYGKQTILELARLCRCGQYYCHLGLQSLTRSKIVLQYGGRLIPVIYDKKRHCLITVLTMEMLSYREKQKIQQAGYA